MLLMQAPQRPTLMRVERSVSTATLDAILGSVQEPAILRRPPGLARMAEAASRLTARRADILCQLLRTGGAPVEADKSPLRPIWACESIIRARLTIRLLASLDRLRKTGSPHMLSLDMERDAADRLSAGLSLLKDLTSPRPLPCSALLRHVAQDLMELFGATVGDITIATQIEPFAIANVKRRALVLATCNLLLHAMTDGFPNRRAGTILVSLRRVRSGQICLTVADNGSATTRDWAQESSEVVEDLAAILDGRLVQHHDNRGGTITELTMPA